MVTNGIRDRYEKGLPSFGTYIETRSTQAIEMAALGGLDHVRINAYKQNMDPEMHNASIHYAYSYGLTPWVRSRLDKWKILQAIDNGALVVSVKVSTVDDAKRAVDAVHYTGGALESSGAVVDDPSVVGSREISRPKRCSLMPWKDYFEWYDRNVLLSLSLEDPAVIENETWKEIVKVPGADIVQYGKGGMGTGLRATGEYFNPRVLELEKRVVAAALDAGKQVSLMHFINDEDFERVERWIEQGVLLHCLDSDGLILQRQYARAGTWLQSRSAVSGKG